MPQILSNNALASNCLAPISGSPISLRDLRFCATSSIDTQNIVPRSSNFNDPFQTLRCSNSLLACYVRDVENLRVRLHAVLVYSTQMRIDGANGCLLRKSEHRYSYDTNQPFRVAAYARVYHHTMVIMCRRPYDTRRYYLLAGYYSIY